MDHIENGAECLTCGDPLPRQSGRISQFWMAYFCSEQCVDNNLLERLRSDEAVEACMESELAKCRAAHAPQRVCRQCHVELGDDTGDRSVMMTEADCDRADTLCSKCMAAYYEGGTAARYRR